MPDLGLRTDGLYAITRHPIYTGLLGMLLGSALLGGLGQWIVLVPAGLVVVGLKIWAEERLLLATFPDEYVGYRERVPRLILGGARSSHGPVESEERGHVTASQLRPELLARLTEQFAVNHVDRRQDRIEQVPEISRRAASPPRSPGTAR